MFSFFWDNSTPPQLLVMSVFILVPPWTVWLILNACDLSLENVCYKSFSIISIYNSFIPLKMSEYSIHLLLLAFLQKYFLMNMKFKQSSIVTSFLLHLSSVGSAQWLRVQFSSVTQSYPTLCNPMNHSTPGLPVHHQLPEFTQTHVHRVGDAIQPFHPLSSPFPPPPNPSQHQSLFQWVNSSHEVAKVLEFQL